MLVYILVIDNFDHNLIQTKDRLKVLFHILISPKSQLKNCEFILNNPPALEEEFEYHGRLLAAVPDHSDNQYHHERMLQNVPSVINVDSL